MKFEAEPFKSLFELEESVLSYWSKNDIYAKSLAKNSGGEVFSFYDGPPFITGMPHWGTLLPTIAKDVIPRYQTMKGKYVRRIWGWDVHGLPAENQVEKKLGLKTKKDIEALGVEKFISECRKYVAETSLAWRWYIDHIGRWVDMENAYRTDNLAYMESVMWAFKQLYDKDLIYRGRRTSLYCPRCATPLSKFEVTMDEGSYRDVTDPGVTVAFRAEGDDVSLLAWTTTPWTLPANFGLAVDPEAEYVKVTDGEKRYILAHQALERYGDLDLEIVERFKGEKLLGQQYEPLFPHNAANSETDYKVYPATFVSMEEGTGIVHIAPGFGEDDSTLGEQVGLTVLETLDDQGHFKPELGEPLAGLYYKKADPIVTADLEKRGLLFKQESIAHSYPHCYRCETPLIYKAQVSWYLRIDPLRDELLKTNEQIKWVPEHFGSGRFRHNLETAPDWSLSRTRYWGSPIPVWETEDGEIFVPGSIEELEKLSGQKITDLHRPFIDQVELTLPSGKKARRVKEVLDCWFESGSMPYAQDHYPFENKEVFEAHFPADFIIEYTGQLRGWFYYLHVLGNALKQSAAFRNVVTTGVLFGTDGRKMSKSYGNYPDPKATIEKHSAEALRLYFMSSRVMQGEDMAISETDIRDSARALNVLHNSFRYLLTYAKAHSWQPAEAQSTDVLDRWISLRLEELIATSQASLGNFDLPGAARVIRPFIEDLSTWYIRRSRDRFVAGDAAALQTLYNVLVRFAEAVAPVLPFTAEHIYQTLTEKESVHLANYPTADEVSINEQSDLLRLMDQVRSIASTTHMLRSQEGISLRQPLSSLSVKGFTDLENRPEFSEILRDEVNVQQVDFQDKADEGWFRVNVEGGMIRLETKLTPELEAEGRYRELIRLLQDARKKAGLVVGEKAALTYFTSDEAYLNIFQTRAKDVATASGLAGLNVAESKVGLESSGDEALFVKFDKS
ncbi:MAG: isoleucine--tRNA ligase [Candidatus Berkelbacteria bacterium]|nr:MAG: isoleucine--tRNA ligase [Candidatus Berkelbacteria bacterium]QQG51599.1 MAG: isoleucine--tRNA ligase [Candidatus Berkelbacteria bacterium]